jgi:hypothetical protein
MKSSSINHLLALQHCECNWHRCRRMMTTKTMTMTLQLVLIIILSLSSTNQRIMRNCDALSFFGRPSQVVMRSRNSFVVGNSALFLPELCPTSSTISYFPHTTCSGSKSYLHMRKQKASDQRTRRRQQMGEDYSSIDNGLSSSLSSARMTMTTTLTTSPMDTATWKSKKLIGITMPTKSSNVGGGGRGRSRKRSALYNSLAYYHQHFLKYLTAEYQAEVRTLIYGIIFKIRVQQI